MKVKSPETHVIVKSQACIREILKGCKLECLKAIVEDYDIMEPSGDKRRKDSWISVILDFTQDNEMPRMAIIKDLEGGEECAKGTKEAAAAADGGSPGQEAVSFVCAFEAYIGVVYNTKELKTICNNLKIDVDGDKRTKDAHAGAIVKYCMETLKKGAMSEA